MHGTLARAWAYSALATMLDAGVPVVRSLQTAFSSAKGGSRRAFAAVRRDVAAGGAMSEAMAAQGRWFSPLEVMLVRAGESCGDLPGSLRLLADWHSFCSRQRGLLTSNLLLPVVILHVAALIAPLPLVFSTNLGVLGYVRHVAGTLLVPYVLLLAVVFVIHLAPRMRPLRRLLDHLTLMIPALGLGVRQLTLGRYFRVFAMLEGAGVPIVQAAAAAAEVEGNSVVLDLVRGGAESASVGRPMSEGFSPQLEEEYRSSWLIGEETGTLSETSSRLAGIATERAEHIFAELARWVPRLIYLAICGILAVRVLQGWGAVRSM